MYAYSPVDQAIVDARVAQFRDQVARYLAGAIGEDEFKPLRLQNGIYIERHAPMLRVAIPYGMVSSRQFRALADIARRHDRGFGHFTTRQNIQFNWVKLEETPDILADLAAVQMHAIQTSGSCIRNVTTDHFAGAAADEIVDPRPYAELLRQWSTLHPEFAFLPRKFKVALNGAKSDRTAIAVHDLAFDLYCDEAGAVRARVLVGGGQGRTPRLAALIKPDLQWQELLTYSEAVLRAYNRFGRRDNIYKARIKILVEALGPEAFAREVEADWAALKQGPGTLTDADLARVAAHFRDPPLEAAPFDLADQRLGDPAFSRWLTHNVSAHRHPAYACVTLSLKSPGRAPGDASADDLDTIASLADAYSFSEARISHHQNVVLAHVARADLRAVWRAAQDAGLAEPNIGLATDIICCPGGDYCSLANAKSIPLAQAIQREVAPAAEAAGPVSIKISGCINACGHHHVGTIGILGVEKNDEEWYQILIGGRADSAPALGRLLGRALPGEEVPAAVARLLGVHAAERRGAETFLETLDRIGVEPFKAALLPASEALPA